MSKAASTSNDTTWWWIKGDGCDVVKGLCESVSGKWSGDVDLNDGQMNRLYQKFQQQVQWVDGIGLESRSTSDRVQSDLRVAMEYVDSDLEFISSGTHACIST